MLLLGGPLKKGGKCGFAYWKSNPLAGVEPVVPIRVLEVLEWAKRPQKAFKDKSKKLWGEEYLKLRRLGYACQLGELQFHRVKPKGID